MMDYLDGKKGYSAIIYVMESSNSVVVHFGGFDDITECKKGSQHLMDDLGIESLLVPKGVTVH